MSNKPTGTVWVCSNPRCEAVWDEDPQGHCPKCIQANGGGYSTMRRTIMSLFRQATK